MSDYKGDLSIDTIPVIEKDAATIKRKIDECVAVVSEFTLWGFTFSTHDVNKHGYEVFTLSEWYGEA